MKRPSKHGKSPRAKSGEAVEKLQGGREIRPDRFIRPTLLRIIGGDLRRRSVIYNGDLATRPMKDSVRENLFNILGRAVEGAVTWDLFAGTGVLAMEALSRKAIRAIAFDAARGCAKTMRESAEQLGIADRLEIVVGDTFRLAPPRFQQDADQLRIVFCCPPYALWDSEQASLIALVNSAMQGAAPGSCIVCEMERKQDPGILPPADWDIRHYGNVTLSVAEVN